MKKHIFVYISYLLNVAFIAVVYFQLNATELFTCINSDTLYLPLLFRDIVIDHARDINWIVPPATCFFPDLVIYFAVNFVFKNFILAKLITGIVFCVLLLLGFSLLINESVYKINPLSISIGVNLLLLFQIASLSAGDFVFTYHLTATNYHLGAYIISIFCFYLAMQYLRNKTTSNLVVLLFLYILTFSSDFLTLCHLTIPLFIVSALLFCKKSYRVQAYYLLAANCLGLILGYLLYHYVEGSSTIFIYNIDNISYLKFNFHAVAKAYSVMLNYHLLFLKTMDVRAIIMILCIISLIISATILVKKILTYFKKDEISKHELLELAYLTLLVTQVIVLYNAPAITGIFVGNDMIRYNVYVLFILILNYAYLFHKLFQPTRFLKHIYLVPFLLTVFFSFYCIKTYIKTDIKQGADNLFGYYPDYVKKVDELCYQHNLKYGLAEFWLAKPITMLSKNNLRVYQVYFDMCPFPHVVNFSWFWGTDDGKTAPPVFNFVLMNNLNDSIIYKKLKNHILDTLTNDDITLVKISPFTFERGTCSMSFVDEP